MTVTREDLIACLYVKGFGKTEALAEALGASADAVEAAVANLVARGEAEQFRVGARLSPSGKAAAEHLQNVLSGLERVDQASQIGTRWRSRRDRLRWCQMSGVNSGQVELALEILLGDLEILQGHVRALMTEEFHHRGKTDTRPQHLRCIGVSKLVRNDAGGNSDRRDNLPQCTAEPANQHVAAARPRQ